MTKRLVFVHGRAQQDKDPAALKKEWVDSFRDGLAVSSLDLPLADADIRFPYYGDTLRDMAEGRDHVADVIVKGVEQDELERAFMQAVLQQVLEKAGVSDAELVAAAGAEVIEKGILNEEWLHGILKAIDRYVPFASGASIALATHDVYQYLRNPAVTRRIDDGVKQAMLPDVPTVVVSHSLGTVVAYRLLKQQGEALGWKVPLFVTLGSPLAVEKIRSLLAPIGHPPCVGKWFNAMDERDVVALYPLDKRNFKIAPPIENKTDVRNFTENRHGIAGYLADAEVAKRIRAAL